MCLFLLGAVWASSPAVAAENLPTAEQLAPVNALAGQGFDALSLIQRLARGEALDYRNVLASLQAALLGSMQSGLRLLSMLMAPIVLMAVLRQLLGEDEKKVIAAGYVCYLGAALVLMQQFQDSAGDALLLAAQVGQWIEAVFPVLTALMTACGATLTAAAYAPLLTLAGGMLAGMIRTLALTMCSAACVIAIAGNLSERFRLSKLLDMLKGALVWIMGTALTGFLGLVAMSNLLGSGQDSAAMRAAKYAASSLIPGVGGEIADTMGAVSSSAILVKNATGITGLIALVTLCALPLMRLLASILAVRLCVALAEPLGGSTLLNLIERFGDVLSMLMVASISAVVIGVVLAGAVLTVGNAAILPG